MFVELLILAGLHQPAAPVKADPAAADSAQSTLALHCFARKPLVTHLKGIGAKPLFIGLSNSGLAMEVWREPSHSGDDPWVGFITRSDGIACVFANGEGLNYAEPDPSLPTTGPDNLEE